MKLGATQRRRSARFANKERMLYSPAVFRLPVRLCLTIQPAFRIQRRLATACRAGNRLAVNMVFHIARRPNAFNIGGTCVAIVAAARNQVARGIHV